MNNISHNDLANAIRFLAIDAVEKAKSGHPGMPMGAADMATLLFKDFMRFDPEAPNWINRDRFILSAGHGSMLLYAILHLTGYKDFTLEQIQSFRQFGSKTAGHPEYGHGAGIETTTGPLGQGLANAVGIALGEAMAHARFGDVIDHYTYVIAGDGDLMEGISHEAIGLAGHLKLRKLIVLFDDNNISIDGDVSLAFTGDHLKRFSASGWNCQSVDGHDPNALRNAISEAKKSDKPTLLACKTIIGKGAPNKQNTAGIHGAPLGAEEIALTREAYAWPHDAFHIPDDIKQAWHQIGIDSAKAHQKWQETFKDKISDVQDFLNTDIPDAVCSAIETHKENITKDKPKWATRVASQKALEVINPILPQMIGGSADLTGSNNTKTSDLNPISKNDYSGRYIHYGIREHGMAAAMNGLALWGGFIPYSGTFLVFSDYSRPSLRLAALMGLRVIHVLTHDSIGLGEDGPTHQPIEHLASLRAIPNMTVYRPADGVETAECWLLALENKIGPAAIALTRQGLRTVRIQHNSENLSAKGAYILKEAESDHKVTLYASGSEVEIILDAAEILENDKIGARVVSVPSMEHFYKQDVNYQKDILKGDIRIACEAALKQGWEGFISDSDAFVGMEGFGASAPYKDLYKAFGITAEKIVGKVKSRL